MMAMSNTVQTQDTVTRVTFKHDSVNSLFREWLQELYVEAKEKKSRLESMLKEALDSLSKYPLPLHKGSECLILKGFEKNLCAHLDKRLETYSYNSVLAHAMDTVSTTSSYSSSENTVRSSSPMSDIINVEHGNSHFNNSHSPSTQPSFSNMSHSQDNNLVIDPAVSTLGAFVADTDSSQSQRPSSQQKKNKSKSKKYKPARKSGAYALLLALLEHTKENLTVIPVTKEKLIDKAQKYSEESFIRPKPETFYTAWSNMTRLVSKGLVTVVRNKKATYILSEKGLELAEELFEDSKNTVGDINDIIFNSPPSTSSVRTEDMNVIEKPIAPPSPEVVDMPPDSFDIVLLIDKNETSGLSKKNDPTVAQFNKYPDLKHEYRSLKVGDFTWVARHKLNKDIELVLPYIVERKRMDDLGASIKDGRFHEQKFRLRKCGLKNVIYMIENYGSNKHVGLPIQHLMQAVANTRVQDDFKVHITDSLTNSVRFLAMMTKRLTIRYKDKHLKGFCREGTGDDLMTFNYFNKASAKTKPFTATESLIKLLVQLKGVSVEKALAITAKFKTPKSLIIRYRKCDRVEGESLLANLKYGNMGRNVGPTVSKAIHQLYSSHRRSD